MPSGRVRLSSPVRPAPKARPVTERISLEVPASPSSLSTARMVLGGLGTRLGYPLDDIDDLYLSVEEVVHTALCYEHPERLRLDIEVAADSLCIHIGRFSSPGFRGEVQCPPGTPVALDLARLLERTVDEVSVSEDADGEYSVILRRRHRGLLS